MLGVLGGPAGPSSSFLNGSLWLYRRQDIPIEAAHALQGRSPSSRLTNTPGEWTVMSPESMHWKRGVKRCSTM